MISWRAHPLPWALAAALLSLALLALLLAPRWQQQAEADRAATLQQLQQRARQAERQTAPAADWRLQLPAAGSADVRLAQLIEGALREGVQLQTIDQAPLAMAPDGVARQTLTLGAQGRYVELRGFIERALQTDPALMLEQLTLSRDGPEAEMLQASLRVTLLQRAEAGPGVQP